jgi:phospholipid/cholesterol/gamma-HCH transport system substrate-binding protein
VSRSLSFIQAVFLGLTVLAVLGLGAVGLFAVGSQHWPGNDSFNVQVGFPHVRGVEVGTRVRVQGIDAGEVESLQVPAAPGQAVVLRLRLDGKVRHLLRADAVAQIVSEGMIGGKVVEVAPGTVAAAELTNGATIASRNTPELTDVLEQVDGLVQAVRKGEGSLGKLARDDRLYEGLVDTLRQGRGTLESIQQDAEALKSMPVVRNYVKDAQQLLVRPDCECNRQSFAEADLFEPGQAVLTTTGRQQLDRLVPWLEGLKHAKSEVVVSSYAAAGDPQLARSVTQKQSEAVCAYLTDHYAVQKMGWFTRRKVTPIGLGTQPPPGGDKDRLPAPRVEVLVFVPQG